MLKRDTGWETELRETYRLSLGKCGHRSKELVPRNRPWEGGACRMGVGARVLSVLRILRGLLRQKFLLSDDGRRGGSAWPGGEKSKWILWLPFLSSKETPGPIVWQVLAAQERRSLPTWPCIQSHEWASQHAKEGLRKRGLWLCQLGPAHSKPRSGHKSDHERGTSQCEKWPG